MHVKVVIDFEITVYFKLLFILMILGWELYYIKIDFFLEEKKPHCKIVDLKVKAYSVRAKLEIIKIFAKIKKENPKDQCIKFMYQRGIWKTV